MTNLIEAIRHSILRKNSEAAARANQEKLRRKVNDIWKESYFLAVELETAVFFSIEWRKMPVFTDFDEVLLISVIATILATQRLENTRNIDPLLAKKLITEMFAYSVETAMDTAPAEEVENLRNGHESAFKNYFYQVTKVGDFLVEMKNSQPVTKWNMAIRTGLPAHITMMGLAKSGNTSQKS